jgi:hypothetical protein
MEIHIPYYGTLDLIGFVGRRRGLVEMSGSVLTGINIDQNFRPLRQFDQYVAAPVGVQPQRLFSLEVCNR